MQKEAAIPEAFVEHGTHAEAAIRALLDELAQALRQGDRRRIMAFYADDLRAFDLLPPLQSINRAAFMQQAWDVCWAEALQFPIEFVQHDLRVHADGDVAFSHCMVHMKGLDKDGQMIETWFRNTRGLQRADGQWLITHEHNSVPLDKETGAGLVNLAP